MLPKDFSKRFDASRRNLIQLLPGLAELKLWDNSAHGDPAQGQAPQPMMLLHWRHGGRIGPDQLDNTPEWAKPIVAAALKAERR